MQHRGAYTRGYCDLTSWPPDIPVPVLLPGSSRFALELRFLLSPSKSLRRHYISPHTNTLRTPNSSDRTPPDLRYFFFVVVFLHDARFLRKKTPIHAPAVSGRSVGRVLLSFLGWSSNGTKLRHRRFGRELCWRPPRNRPETTQFQQIRDG